MTAPRRNRLELATVAAVALDSGMLNSRQGLLNSAAVLTIALSLWAGAALGQDSQTQGNDQAAVQAPQEGGGAQTTIMVADSQEHGQYLVDGEGRAVYGFSADEQGQGDATQAVSNCYDACAEAWPPVLVQDDVPTTGEMAMPNLLGATLRADGSMQVTYNGWPLYYFIQDQGPGQATGQDVQAHGGEWYLLRPTGEMVQDE